MKKIAAILILIAMFALKAHTAEAASKTTYFKCVVKEPVSSKKNVEVTVKFAVKNLDVIEETGELVDYPGMTQEQKDFGSILVTPIDLPGNRMAMMSNLNGQGGDLRIEGEDIRLFGDGSGYQFTDLVLWGSGDYEDAHTKGYVRDYGPAYGDGKEFTQFITCEKSNKKL